MRKRRPEITVGIFTLMGFVLLVIITLNLKQMFLFTRTYDLVVYFKKVRGLEVGATVHVYGVVAGEVKGIEYVAGEYPVKVILSLRRNIKIYRNARVGIVTAGLIGETKIEIDAGTSDQPVLAHGDDIQGEEMVDLYQALSYAPRIVEDVAATISSLRQIITEEKTQRAFVQTIENLSSLSSNLDDLLTTTSADISEIADSFRDSAQKISLLIEETQKAVQELKGDIAETKKALTTGIEDLTSEVKEVGSHISQTAGSINQTSSKLNELLTEHKDELSQALNDLQVATENFKNIVRHVSEGKGTLGHLINDPTVYYALRDALRSLREILSGIRQEYMEERLQYEQPPGSPTSAPK